MADVALTHPELDGTGKDNAALLVIDGAVSPGNGDRGSRQRRQVSLWISSAVSRARIVGDAGRCRQRPSFAWRSISHALPQCLSPGKNASSGLSAVTKHVALIGSFRDNDDCPRSGLLSTSETAVVLRMDATAAC
jgi:hypothetical protein